MNHFMGEDYLQILFYLKSVEVVSIGAHMDRIVPSSLNDTSPLSSNRTWFASGDPRGAYSNSQDPTKDA